MSNLNRDVLFSILKELEYDRNSLYSCLLVNKTWCEIVIPILWKNPFNVARKLRLVIISHLNENLRSQGINLSSEIQEPLFNYISFCKQLDIIMLESVIFYIKDLVEESKMSIVRDEVYKLFININTKFTHLYISSRFDYPIHLIPGAEHCFSELKTLCCYVDKINQGSLEGLNRIIKSIKKLAIIVIKFHDDCFEVVKLIEAQQNLNDVQFTGFGDESFCKALEESLIKHANTIQYFQIGWIPNTKIFSCLVNLISLEIILKSHEESSWNNLENISLPVLKILKTQNVPSKVLASLIEATKGNLIEINIEYHEYHNNNRHIQAIYQNCPNLKYLKLLIRRSDISELENLLLNCQYLDGLFIVVDFYNVLDYYYAWDDLFKVITKSSPINLFKFKFSSYNQSYSIIEFKLKFLFENWKGRKPMLLQVKLNDLDSIGKYKGKGIIKEYVNDFEGIFNDFEWIHQKKSYPSSGGILKSRSSCNF